MFRQQPVMVCGGLGQTVDGPSNGAAPLPWDIRCNPTQMFHTEIRYVEVPHTATIAVCMGIV